ncbi:acyltransferase family protein [Breoghania sp.]|uniref:acyltransferase family protein n=1 Tax=Breoghania sp. TaxID=2065378 RepID=UPI0029CA008A|nr:acyltransferase family protein [Breoghania sp.]
MSSGTSGLARAYRIEIDGLRSLAVLPVILLHAGFDLFGGGFVGVDVFFVISGFLIAGIIIRDLEAGRFSLVDFYIRRARRILPALTLVLLVTVPFAWAWLVPPDLEEYGKSTVAVTTFTSNFFFLKKSGYFDSIGELKPLLHTWSLAVEEQYYIVFPLFMLLFWQRSRRVALVLLTVIALASLALAQALTVIDPTAGFFLPFTRVWELLIGVFTAILIHRRGGEGTNGPAALIGLLMIVAAVFLYGENTPFPSIYALLPTVGAALVLFCTGPGTIAFSILSSRIPVLIGRISYSAYLWHQPLFAFMRYRFPEEAGPGAMLALSAASLGLAYLTVRFVENPFRERGRIHIGFVVGGAIASVTVFAIGSGFIRFHDGYPSRLSPAQQKIVEYKNYPRGKFYRSGECFVGRKESDAFGRLAPNCAPLIASDGTSAPLLWGDSHAAALYWGLQKLVPDLGQFTMSACPPLPGVDIPRNPYCRSFNDAVMKWIRRNPPRTIFLMGNWRDVDEKGVFQTKAMLETVRTLKGINPDMRIVVVGSVPHWLPDLPMQMLRYKISLRKAQRLEMLTLPALQELDLKLREQVEEAGDGAIFVSLLDQLCSGKECTAIVPDPLQEGQFEPLAWDVAHLTAGGSKRAADIIADAIGGLGILANPQGDVREAR